jgi:hypothetical protein
MTILFHYKVYLLELCQLQHSRHMSDLLVLGQVPMDFNLAPFFQLKHDPNTDQRYEQAETETHCTVYTLTPSLGQ